MALYEANPQAFSNNINVLYAGATLRIPAEESLHRQGPEAATAAVLRHRQSWQSDQKRKPKLAEADDGAYGPVRRGETLSAIAAGLLQDGVTLNQLMVALLAANPLAFANNIHVLYEGAMLRMPDTATLHDQPPETATAEVRRQTEAWQAGLAKHAQLGIVSADLLLEHRRYAIPKYRGWWMSVLGLRGLEDDARVLRELPATIKQAPLQRGLWFV
ncbi:MAG: hypothetical protein OEN20_10850 [Gammaproteobacteria bacterium]|nr:hypothetical protein [Gammaproteobacteria bacterium]